MSIIETVRRVKKVFEKQSTAPDISDEIKSVFKAGNSLLGHWLKEHPLKDDTTAKDINRLGVDPLIIGTILTVLMLKNEQEKLQSIFTKLNSTPCPMNFGDNISTLYSNKDFKKMILSIGMRALKREKMPFTTTIDYKVFPQLEHAGLETDFAQYKLFADTTKGSQEKERERAIAIKTESIQFVMNAFAKPGDNIPVESKAALAAANTLLQQLLVDEHLKNDASEFATQADRIIAGAIIAVLIENDKHGEHNLGRKYLYPLFLDEIPTLNNDIDDGSATLEKMIPLIGKLALLKKIPFTGKIDYNVFPLLAPVQNGETTVGIGPDYFARYSLDPEMDITKKAYKILIKQKITMVDEVIFSLSQKIGGKRHHVAVSAPEAAANLLKQLNAAVTQYERNLKNQLDISHENFLAHMDSYGKTFIQECTTAINTAKSQLENDLDWDAYLQNLLTKLANAVIRGFNKVTGMGIRFFEFNVANSVREINQFERSLNEIDQNKPF